MTPPIRNSAKCRCRTSPATSISSPTGTASFLITVSRPTIAGEMYGIINTLLAGRGSLLTPIAAPIAYVPMGGIAEPSYGRISAGAANYDRYRAHLQKIMDEPFAVFLPG